MTTGSVLPPISLLVVLSLCSIASVQGSLLKQANKSSQPEAFTSTALSGGNEFADVISRNIERYRKGDVTLRILDENRKPVGNANVEIKQVQHDFLFGCSYPLEEGLPQDTAKFQELFSSIFNYLTTENHFKWTILEPRRGRIDWGQIDRLLLWAQSQGIKVKGHTLVWGDYPNGDTGVPPWIRWKPQHEVHRLLEKRIRDVAGRYSGRVMAWDVVNEPIHEKWFEEHLGNEYVELSLKWTRETDSRSTLLVNEYNILTDENSMAAYLALVNRLKSSNVPFDAIGLEEHQGYTWLSPSKIYEGLDEIAKLGYDIHITEFDVNGVGQPIAGGFKTGVWDEQTQAEYYELFYRTAFSHPKVKAISTWSFLDPGWTKEGCGLIRPDLTRKPVYYTLQHLINEQWRTEIESKTDSNGVTRLRGFYGTYEVRLISSEIRVGTFHLREQGPRDIEVVLVKPQPNPIQTSTSTRFTESRKIETPSISNQLIVAGAIIAVIAAGTTLALKLRKRLIKQLNTKESKPNESLKTIKG